MTVGNVAPIGEYAISRAIDMTGMIEAEESSNIKISAYLGKDENGEKVKNRELNIESNEGKLYVDIAVLNEGYFNGEINLENSNFKISKVKESLYVKESTESKVVLNQIGANNNDVVTIEMYVESNIGEELEKAKLGSETGVKLTGTYIDSEKKNGKEIEVTDKVTISYKTQEGIESELTSKIITKGEYGIKEKDAETGEETEEIKKVVQIEVTSRIKGNSYPVDKTEIEMEIPEGAEAEGYARSIEATGREYKWEAKEGKIVITAENKEVDGKIIWKRGVEDKYIITLLSDNEIDTSELKVTSRITTSDGREVTKDVVSEEGENEEGIVTVEVENKEKEIYKGKIYTKEGREYTDITKINVNYAKIENDIEVVESRAIYEEGEKAKEANIKYTKTKIDKAEVMDILGETGKVEIIDQDGNARGEVTGASEVNGEGKVEITYPETVRGIVIKTTSPKKQGQIRIENTKKILEETYTREDIRKLTGIKQEVEVAYSHKDYKNSVTSKIELKETTSKANITIETKDGNNNLSTINKNENVKVTATLETKNESEDLYKNPTFKIVFPKEVTNIKVTQANQLYAEGLTRTKCSLGKENDGRITITIEYEGEQNSYSTEFIKGLQV